MTSRFRVALNATCLNDRPSGAKQRFLGIYRELARSLPYVEFIVFEPKDCSMNLWFKEFENVKTFTTPIPSEGRFRKFIYSTSFWNQALGSGSFDIFEGFHLPLPTAYGAKTIFTVHDVRRIHSDCSLFERIAFRHSFARAIRKSDVLVTVSEAMKRELLPYCSESQIYVIPNGLDGSAKFLHPSVEELEAFQIKYSLPERYLLAVGHLEPRKNYLRLIQALSLMHRAGQSHHLLIVGNDSGERNILDALIAELGLKDFVTLASGLSDFEVRCAYSLCKLFIFSSTYEGFGIPILEAMSAGRPMALSDIPVFREITEGRSIYFSPFDPQDIARGITLALSSKVDQDCMVRYGLQRSKRFEYSAIATNYQALYRELLI